MSPHGFRPGSASTARALAASLLAAAAVLGAACGDNAPPSSVPAQAPSVILTATPYARPPQPIIVDPSGAVSGGQPNFREVPYRVEAGDTLLGIASRFDTTVEAIVRRNNLPNASDLKIGQDLIIPTNAVVVATQRALRRLRGRHCRIPPRRRLLPAPPRRARRRRRHQCRARPPSSAVSARTSLRRAIPARASRTRSVSLPRSWRRRTTVRSPASRAFSRAIAS
jgi:LysM repeat protein